MDVAIGIEIGATKVQAGLGREDGSLLSHVRQRVDVAAGAAGIRRALPALIDEALQEAQVPSNEITALGAGFSGLVRMDKGTIVRGNNVAGWADFPLRRWLEGQYPVPVVLENDANAAGYAEAVLGVARGVRRLLYLNIGSGIGGGWIVDGSIDNGQGLGAAEIGHTWVPYPGSRFMAELERIASGRAIGRRARSALEEGETSVMAELAGGNLARVSARIVYAAAERGDALARRLLAETCDALAMGIGNAINLYQPERVVIGGGVATMGPLFWSLLREQTRRYVFEPFLESYEILPAALGEGGVLVGALLLALRKAKSQT